MSLSEKLQLNEELSEYCNNGVYSEEKMISELYWLIKEEITNGNIPSPKIEITVHSKSLILDVDIKQKQISVTYKIEKNSLQIVSDEIESKIEILTKGIKSIDKLNSILVQKQRDISASTIIKYKYGNGEYCVIDSDWSSDLVLIRLSDRAVRTLIDIDNSLETTLGDYLYDMKDLNICAFIKSFNRLTLNIRLGAKLETQDPKRELLIDSILEGDVEELVSNSRISNNKGIYRIDYTDIIEELGTYLARIECDIDFASRKVSVRIVGDVYDLESDKVVTSKGLVAKIEQMKEEVGRKWQEKLK